MADPFRLKVMKAITESLEQIAIADGYQFDMATSVYRGRTLFGPSDPLPMLSILEPPIPLQQSLTPPLTAASKGMWDLMIQGFMKDDPKNPSDDAYKLLADVKKRLAYEQKRVVVKGLNDPNPFGLGRDPNNPKKNHIIKIERIGFGVVRPPDNVVSDKAYFWLDFTLQIAEDINDPFV